MEFFRRNRRSMASQMLALMLVVWANMALAPCAMAASAPTGGHMDGSHLDGAHVPVVDAPCAHCPPEHSRCDTDLSSQCSLEAQVLDGSAVRGPVFDYPTLQFALAPSLAEFSPNPAKQAVHLLPQYVLPPPGTALHKRFCVYLK